jgi:anti-sigma factor RsiW
MSCENSNRVHAYHDGALTPEQAAQVEAHLRVCAECRELLEDLKRLTLVFSSVPFSEMTTAAQNRMQGAWHAARQARDRGVRVLAGWMTAAAAAVLVLVPVLWPQSSADRDQTPASANSGAFVDSIAFIAPSGPHDEANSDLVQVAQWFANDLSVDQGQ